MESSVFPFFRRSRLIAIDCGARHVSCGVFSVGATGRLVLQRQAVEPFEGECVSVADWSTSTARALVVLARRERLSGCCHLALPGRHTLLQFIRIAAPEESGRAKMIAAAARRNLPCLLEQVAWDHLPAGENGGEIEVLLAAARSEIAGGLAAAALAAGLCAARLVPAAVALMRAFQHVRPEQRDGILLVEIGARSTHLVFLGAAHFFIRTLHFGGDALTRAVGEEARIDFAAAEALKLAVGGGPAGTGGEGLRRASERFGERLLSEIARTVAARGRQAGRVSPARVFLTGGGAAMPELPAHLETALKLRVERFAPLDEVGCSPAVRGSTAVPGMAALVGLAACLTETDWPGLNLLPAEVRRTQGLRRSRPALAASSLLLLGSPLPIAAYCHRAALRATQTGIAAETALASRRALAAREKQELAELGDVRRRLGRLRDLAGSTSNWIACLGDLQARLAPAGDGWLENIRLAKDPEAKPAGAARPLRLMIGGTLLDRDQALVANDGDLHRRAMELLDRFRQSPFVGAIESERFDQAQPGMLRFDLTVAIDPARLP